MWILNEKMLILNEKMLTSKCSLCVCLCGGVTQVPPPGPMWDHTASGLGAPWVRGHLRDKGLSLWTVNSGPLLWCTPLGLLDFITMFCYSKMRAFAILRLWMLGGGESCAAVLNDILNGWAGFLTRYLNCMCWLNERWNFVCLFVIWDSERGLNMQLELRKGMFM